MRLSMVRLYLRTLVIGELMSWKGQHGDRIIPYLLFLLKICLFTYFHIIRISFSIFFCCCFSSTATTARRFLLTYHTIPHPIRTTWLSSSRIKNSPKRWAWIEQQQAHVINISKALSSHGCYVLLCDKIERYCHNSKIIITQNRKAQSNKK